MEKRGNSYHNGINSFESVKNCNIVPSRRTACCSSLSQCQKRLSTPSTANRYCIRVCYTSAILQLYIKTIMVTTAVICSRIMTTQLLCRVGKDLKKSRNQIQETKELYTCSNITTQIILQHYIEQINRIPIDFGKSIT